MTLPPACHRCSALAPPTLIGCSYDEWGNVTRRLSWPWNTFRGCHNTWRISGRLYRRSAGPACTRTANIFHFATLTSLAVSYCCEPSSNIGNRLQKIIIRFPKSAAMFYFERAPLPVKLSPWCAEADFCFTFTLSTPVICIAWSFH